MKQTAITGIIIIVIVGLLSIIVWGSRSNQAVSTEPTQNEQASVSESPITVASDALIFFYGNTCPHCEDVEEWMTENKIEEKIQIVKKEVYDNHANSLELTQAAKSCSLPTDSIGVPFLYTPEGECSIGTPDITAYLISQVKALEQSSDTNESGERSQE
ncbi:MAG: hypothetical protein ABIB61_01730 [Candidatus Shapirobacteria bacterium]